IEIPLPFFYFIYTYGEPFYISVRNVVTSVQKYHGVFINKSVPFSLLFDYEMSALQRTDICAVRFTSEEISEHNILFDHNFERLKRTSSPRFVPPDFVLVDFSVKCEEELHAMSWLISECTHQYTSKHASEIDIIHNKVRISYLLSCILQTSQDVETILHASSVTSVSEKIARIIMSDYSRNWRIADLASAVLMSESSLKRKMYEEVGSINTFMHKIKLTEGLRKLRRTNIPISVISSDLGYSSPSYFSKVFFKYLNTYPQ
ncbi:AraC family transcriptional regulator, partial [Escherichia albertii]|nr:AraC family transcriptional regulator [Escherichia albertii]